MDSGNSNTYHLLLFDRSEDKRDWKDLALKLFSKTGLAVVVPNYRLTSDSANESVVHTGHAQDIMQCITFLATPNENHRWNHARLFLLGHSCSTHMISSVILKSPHPELQPSADLLSKIHGILFTEGIYDIAILLSRFPKYKDWFIRPAFPESIFPDVSAPEVGVSNLQIRDAAQHIQWLILHSTEDELIDADDSQLFAKHLKEQGAQVEFNGESLKGGHNECLSTNKYIHHVLDFITLIGVH